VWAQQRRDSGNGQGDSARHTKPTETVAPIGWFDARVDEVAEGKPPLQQERIEWVAGGMWHAIDQRSRYEIAAIRPKVGPG
jgi:hypothetical protein